ncbi:flagellar export chaperone FliS [Candidatus Woesearchaeota archaeon]|jgi:flagellar protein FliS|nr:flagellar export chaperone FliS [Candidatus Woesearchaeota archaeon]
MRPSSHALNEYRQTYVEAGGVYADPHSLISMLFNGLQERIAVARGALQRKDHASKGKAVGQSIEILSYLQSCLNLEQGGEIAENLNNLYAYMSNQLFTASASNDDALFEEVKYLLTEVQSGWDGIRGQVIGKN